MLRRFLFGLCCLVSACDTVQGGSSSDRASRQGLDPTDPDILPLSSRSEPLTGFIAITDDVYSTFIENRNYAAANAEQRDEALRVSSRANNSLALGVVGNRENNVGVDGQLVLVLHNARVIGGSQYQATSFSVIDGALTGTAQWALVNPSLHFTASPADDCDRHFRGCQLIPTPGLPHAFGNVEVGGLGLPINVRVDAEWLDRPINQGGNSIETWVIPNTDVADVLWPDAAAQGFVGHRLRCVMPLTDQAVDACGTLLNEDALVSSTTSVNVPRVAVVAESDFQQALSSGVLKTYKAEAEFVTYATQIAGALNHPAAEGVVAQLVPDSLEGTAFDAIVVARAPHVNQGSIHARGVFVVPGPIAFPTTFFGSDVQLVGIDLQSFSGGVCGPVFFPNIQFDPRDIPFSPTQSGYGTDRAAAGRPRATLRFPKQFHERQSIEILACSLFEPPLLPPPPSTTGPKFVPETCNGLDDNANGEIDESSGCAPNSCTACIPVAPSSCGTRRCVSIPDGCGALISCPCP